MDDLINFISTNDGRVEITHLKGYWTVEVELEDDSNYAVASAKTLKKAGKKAFAVLMAEDNVANENFNYDGKEEVKTNDSV